MKPYQEAILVEIETNEVPFVINLEEVTSEESQDSLSVEETKEFLTKNLVQSRRVEIGQRWHSTGRMSNSGKWIPNQRVIVVDTSPETREWSPVATRGTSNKDEGIWAESSDSVGFSTGISVTARIEDQKDAVTFLSNYPPSDSRDVLKAGTQDVLFTVDVTALTNIMDREIRTKIQEVFADESAKYTMDELRSKKLEIMETVRSEVTPYFETRGITITSIGQFGGFTYENPEIQKAIDKVFEAQQDEEVAIAEAKAAEQRKVALQLKGEGEAAAILAAKQGEAEGIKVVADAKAYELEKLTENPEAYLALKKLEVTMEGLKKWDGKYPQYMMGTGDSPNLLMQIPSQGNQND